MQLVPRNHNGSAVVRWRKIPYLVVIKTTDLLAAVANLTDYSANAQDGSTATDVTLSSLDTLANLSAIYIGASEPFVGLTVDVDAANSNASVLTVHYRKSDNSWATTSATDGTDAAGASFGVDGNITWTEPTDWIARELKDIVTTCHPDIKYARRQMFWVRLSFSAALDSSTTQNSIIAMPRTAYAEIPAGFGWDENILGGDYGIYGISALTDAGTANLVVNVAAPGYLPT